MLDFKQLRQMALNVGFTQAGQLLTETIELKPEVRAMCAENSCGKYGACWSCPPSCGSLEECQTQIQQYHQGILVQTTHTLEDSFDIEGMMATESAHKTHFKLLFQELKLIFPNLLALDAGCCTQCKTCTCPTSPCRFPEKKISSMEAYGMLVLEVCNKNNLGYYYGPNTITYTSCFLLE